jgi:diguanylate cyclase (GGDEF)-like protein
VSLTRGRGGVWAFTLALAAAAAVIYLHVDTLPAPVSELRIPLWMLVAAFAITEASAVHIHFRRGAHTLTLGELPLVLGLLFASPGDVMIGWVLGAAVVLALSRSGVPAKIAFNLAQLAVTAGVAALILHALTGPVAQLGPIIWTAAAAAVLVAAAFSAVLVGAAMWLSGEPLHPGKVVETVVMAVVVAGTNTSIGLAGATVIGADPRGVALLVAPVLVVFVAYRAYTAQIVQHTNLEFLFQASRTLSTALDPVPGMAGLLALGLDAFRAEVAEVCLFPALSDGAGSRLVVGSAGRPEGMRPLDAPVARELRELVERNPAARLITPDDVGDALANHLRRLGVRCAMVAGLPGERRRIGSLLIANRQGMRVPFSRDDLKLFETLAHQTGAALGQDRLSRKLNEVNELQADLERKAFHDPLTELANRLLFMDRVDHALKRREGNAAVIYIDLDDFKGVNDTLGHEAGDALLLAAADRLRDSLRPADTPARLGGDEFAVLLLDISEENVRIVADRIIRKLGAALEIAGSNHPIHASLGVAIAESGSLTGAELVRNADVAMYVSKHGGKRGYSIFDPQMSPAPSAADRAPAHAAKIDEELASLAG